MIAGNRPGRKKAFKPSKKLNHLKTIANKYQEIILLQNEKKEQLRAFMREYQNEIDAVGEFQKMQDECLQYIEVLECNLFKLQSEHEKMRHDTDIELDESKEKLIAAEEQIEVLKNQLRSMPAVDLTEVEKMKNQLKTKEEELTIMTSKYKAACQEVTRMRERFVTMWAATWNADRKDNDPLSYFFDAVDRLQKQTQPQRITIPYNEEPAKVQEMDPLSPPNSPSLFDHDPLVQSPA